MKALDGLGLAAVAALTATGIAWMSPDNVTARGINLEYTLREDTAGLFSDKTLDKVEAKMMEQFGPHDAPQLPTVDDVGDPSAFGMSEGELLRGREVYRTKCLHCHGTSGAGDGATAKFLIPRPRNFLEGKLKFTSTLRAAKPTRDDIRRTLRNGVAYTAMPSFQAQPDEEIDALITYVQFLMLRGETESLFALRLDDEGDYEDYEEDEIDDEEFDEILDEYFAEEYEFIQDQWAEAEDEQLFPDAGRTAATAASIERGRELFMGESAGCVNCHNDNGDGRGPNVFGDLPKLDDEGNPMADADGNPLFEGIGYKLKDDWGTESRPADLRKGFYRGGNRPLDLYRRVHQGIKGTPMPAIADMHANDEDVWDLVNYVLSLPYDQ